MHKLTIIIPIYNQKKNKIIKCVESILNQTDKNFNLIIINNGSKNKKIIDFFIKKIANIINFKLINLKKNIGYCAARQMGIDNSSGEYIFLMDSDDSISKDFVFKINRINRKYDLLLLKFMFIGRDKTLSTYSWFNRRIFTKFSRTLYYSAGWSKVISKDFLEKNNIRFFPDNKNIIEDLFFHLLLLNNAKRVYLLADDIYYKYFKYEDSTWTKTHKKYGFRNIFIKNFEKFYKVTNIKNKKLLKMYIRYTNPKDYIYFIKYFHIYDFLLPFILFFNFFKFMFYKIKKLIIQK